MLGTKPRIGWNGFFFVGGSCFADWGAAGREEKDKWRKPQTISRRSAPPSGKTSTGLQEGTTVSSKCRGKVLYEIL